MTWRLTLRSGVSELNDQVVGYFLREDTANWVGRVALMLDAREQPEYRSFEVVRDTMFEDAALMRLGTVVLPAEYAESLAAAGANRSEVIPPWRNGKSEKGGELPVPYAAYAAAGGKQSEDALPSYRSGEGEA